MSTTRTYTRSRHPGVYQRDDKFHAGGSVEGVWKWKALEATTISKAKIEAAEWMAERRGGRIPDRDAITFRGLFDRWQEERTVRERTAEHDRDIFGWYLSDLADKRVQSISRRDLALLLKRMHQTHSAWTCRAVYKIIRGVFAYAVAEKVLAFSPAEGLPAPKQTEARKVARLDSQTIGRLIEATGSDRWKVALALAALGGLRIGEVRALRWRDVDFDADTPTIRVRKSLSRAGEEQDPKTPAAVRTVAMFAPLPGLLRRWKLASPHARPDDLIVCTAEGKSVSERNALRALARAIAKAGIDPDGKRLSLHSLRHSAGSVWITEYGIPIPTASKMLGHASPAITMRIYVEDPRDEETALRDSLARAQNALANTFGGRERALTALPAASGEVSR